MSTSGPVFVAGATGYTGREVVRACVEQGLETHAHVRPDSGRLEHWRSHFEDMGAKVDTTAWTLPAMKATLERLQPGWVYALLGTTRARGKARKDDRSASAVADDYEAVDYGLSIMLLEAAVACGSRPRFCYLSALGADGRSVNAYMGVRKRVEAAVRGSELPFLIARPAFITGEDREESRPAERVAAVIGDGLLGLAARLGAKQLADRYASLTGRQLARGMVALATGDGGAQIVAEVAAIRAASR
ncbi:MAG: NAD(P)H-binding protein [Myxococcales bacterium]|nr:NAD(P)H-binding protein [Myxococcales bacterium]